MTAEIIFDLDGVLWDSCSACSKALNVIVQNHFNGKTTKVFTSVDFHKTMGVKADPNLLAPILFPDEKIDLARDILVRYLSDEVEYITRYGGHIYPGVIMGIKELALTKRLFVLSNCTRKYLDSFLEQSNLQSYFAGTLCYEDTGKAKESNLAYLCKNHQIGDPLLIGDTIFDYQAALINGIPFGYASYGFGDCPKYDLRFDSFSDLIAHFKLEEIS